MISKLIGLLSLLFVFSTSPLLAQDQVPFDDLPPDAEYGKCYAKCKKPDKYETVKKRVIVKEPSTKLIDVPAVYETRQEKVLVKEGGVDYKVIPATYKTVQQEVMVEAEKKSVKTIPAKYEKRTRTVLVSPAKGEWVKKKTDPNCFSENPDDCYIACYVEVPAKYRTEVYEVMVSPAQTIEKVTPAKYKTMTKKIIDQPARTIEVPIDPVYKTVSRKVMITPATTREEKISAEYKTVTERVLVEKGGYSVWTEILCAAETTASTIRKIQRALRGRGYKPGEVDGVLGFNTQEAIKQFQIDNGLPVGNLNIETLEALEVKYQ